MEMIKLFFKTPFVRTIGGFFWFLFGLIQCLNFLIPELSSDTSKFTQIAHSIFGAVFMYGGLQTMINARNPIFGTTQQMKEDTADFVANMMRAKGMTESDIDSVTSKCGP